MMCRRARVSHYCAAGAGSYFKSLVLVECHPRGLRRHPLLLVPVHSVFVRCYWLGVVAQSTVIPMNEFTGVMFPVAAGDNRGQAVPHVQCCMAVSTGFVCGRWTNGGRKASACFMVHNNLVCVRKTLRLVPVIGARAQRIGGRAAGAPALITRRAGFPVGVMCAISRRD